MSSAYMLVQTAKSVEALLRMAGTGFVLCSDIHSLLNIEHDDKQRRLHEMR